MKVLSLTQPYPTLIMIGAKKIETRGWYTSYRGDLAIHAAKAFPRWAQDLCFEEPFISALNAAINRDQIDHFNPTPTGVILGIVTLTDCHYMDELYQKPDEPELSFGHYELGRTAWMLENPRLLSEPIAAKGALGLWNFEHPDLEALLG